MFIFLTTDAFANTVRNLGTQGDLLSFSDTEGDDAKFNPVRRPYRGVQIKENTYATLSVRRPNGKAIPLTSSSYVPPKYSRKNTGERDIGKVNSYADFILQNVEDSRQEKQQIVETFGDSFVYFFGERPRIVNFGGQLINTEDFNWRSQFWYNYDRYLRGTKLVQQNARAYLAYDTMVIEGYVLTAQAVDNSEQPYSIPFSISMLVTNYYDYSRIGLMRFPNTKGGTYKSFDVLNKELVEERGKFVSTGAQVRLQNLLARPGGGVLAHLRSGIRKINEVSGIASSFVDSVNDVVGGRNVRLPLGVAGFLQQQGGAQIAAGSIGGATILTEQYDEVTGQLSDVNGSLKLRVPGSSAYAPPWTSRVTGGPEGYIFENYDEYDTANSPPEQAIGELLKEKENVDRLARIESRNLATEDQATKLAAWNQVAAAGGLLGDIADGVAFAKANFGTLMSAAAFVADPLSVAKASLGIGVGTTSQSRIAGRQEQLNARGIKTAGSLAGEGGIGKYVGFTAGRTFKNVAGRIADGIGNDGEPSEPASVGEVYSSSEYLSSGSQEINYEDVYGTNDYTTLVENDPSTKSSLSEVYGDNNKAPGGSDIDPSSFNEVYGTGQSASTVRSPEQIRQLLEQSQDGLSSDEDTSSIRGVDDADTAIDPIA